MRKRYPINQSPLYRLRGKQQFENILGVSWNAVDKLMDPALYRVWTNEKDREIQQPIHWLGAVHRRIGSLFSRIEVPDYVYSQKGRSYVDNARAHCGTGPLIKTDINKFYPSTTRDMVYRLFLRDFQCASDIAHRLADICCYKQKHLPTGSPLSGRIAFFAASHMFDEIAQVARRNDCRITVYVDDVTLSGAKATKRLLGAIRQIVSRHGLKTKGKKSFTYAAEAAKPVTGAVIVGSALRLPNKRHKKIWDIKQALIGNACADAENLRRSLRGCLQEAAQVMSEQIQHR